MSFPKGLRFVAEKTADIPGPNAYNLLKDPLDISKRGAILENSDHFLKEHPSDVLAGTFKTTSNFAQNSLPAKHPGDDRYAILLKKIEELERVHADGKKAHQTETDHFKQEVIRLSKVCSQQGDSLEKLKKQNEKLDSQIQQFKKSSAADQCELKELRIKLRMSEHERTQLVSKHGPGVSSGAKKVPQSLEAKTKDESRECERKIAELEKAIFAEMKKRESLESYVNEMKGSADEEARKSHDIIKNIQGKLVISIKDSQEARQALISLRRQAEKQEVDSVARLDQYRSILSRVAEEYGLLATSTVTSSKYATLAEDHTTLQLRAFRLERKLANSEGQVVELANLVRYTQEEITLLRQQLCDTREAAAFYWQTLRGRQAILDHHSDHIELHCLQDDVHRCQGDISRETMAVQEIALTCSSAISDLYYSSNDELLSECSNMYDILQNQYETHWALVDKVSRNLAEQDVLKAELANAQVEIIAGQHALADVQISLTEGREARHMLQHRMGELETRTRDMAACHKQALQGERDASQKMSATLQISKTAEKALTTEIEQLNAELVDLSRFQEAYYNLVEETEALVARNNLAEEEAKNLSNFNAEILGHSNPAQRILYVDRIRQELAEVKQKLLMCIRDRDAMSTANEDLRHKVMMYKPVMVPEDSKPRTNLTRVTRPPFATQSMNLITATSTSPCVASDALEEF